MPRTVSVVSVARARSSSILSSAVWIGMRCVGLGRRLSQSCSRISIRSTSRLTRLIRTTLALRIGLRLRRLGMTIMLLACRSLGTRTSVSMRTVGLRCGRESCRKLQAEGFMEKLNCAWHEHHMGVWQMQCLILTFLQRNCLVH